MNFIRRTINGLFSRLLDDKPRKLTHLARTTDEWRHGHGGQAPASEPDLEQPPGDNETPSRVVAIGDAESARRAGGT